MSLQIFDCEQGSSDWLEARRGLVTASTIGRLITPTLKVANNDTSRGLTLTLAAERITGDVEYVYPTFAMQRGTEDEPIARSVYSEHFAPVEETGFMLLDLGNIRLGFSPDGLVSTDGIIEIKSRAPKAQLATVLADEVPPENYLQLQAGLFVTGRNWIDYVSFCAGLPLYVKRVYPNADAFEVIVAAAEKFETDVADIITRYNEATQSMPATERRLEVEDLIF